jgi:hypothetical protein
VLLELGPAPQFALFRDLEKAAEEIPFTAAEKVGKKGCADEGGTAT